MMLDSRGYLNIALITFRVATQLVISLRYFRWQNKQTKFEKIMWKYTSFQVIRVSAVLHGMFLVVDVWRFWLLIANHSCLNSLWSFERLTELPLHHCQSCVGRMFCWVIRLLFITSSADILTVLGMFMLTCFSSWEFKYLGNEKLIKI